MIDPSPTAPQGRISARIAALDVARTGALVAMVVYHFVYDLELFGYVAPGTALTGGWRSLAVATASSFLFLAGISLCLAHGGPGGIRWRGFAKRLAMIAAAAAAITGATYLALGQGFIFFGILHCIAASSILGLLFLRLPDWALAGLALVVLWAGLTRAFPALDAPIWWWTGLQAVATPSVDYVPVFPWFAAFLAGMAVARAMDRAGLWTRLATRDTAPIWTRVGWPGRHSLAIYLIHQPVLIGALYLTSFVIF